MASKLAKVANALAIGVGAGLKGYGEGALTVAMRNRDELHQQMREERAAAASAAATKEERAWRESESGKEREHDFATMEKANEFDIGSEERKLKNDLTLEKLRIAGRAKEGDGTSKLPASLQEVEYLAGIMARNEGVDKPTDAHRLAAFGQVNASSSGGTVPADIKVADELARRTAAAEGREATPQDHLDALKQLTAKSASADPNAVTGRDLLKRMGELDESMGSITSPDYDREYGKLSKEEKAAVRRAKALSEFRDAGLNVDQFTQQSEAEVPQPQSTPAPATDTFGAKPTNAAPKGQGTETSPFLVETPEQAAWVRQNAKPGSFVAEAGQLKRKPGGEE